MSIVSIKGFEKACAEWIVKARIVFRGDTVKDESSQAAIFDELAASAPTTLYGLNLVIAFGLQQHHKTSTSDAVKAYMSNLLSAARSKPMFSFLMNSYLLTQEACTNHVLHWSRAFMVTHLPPQVGSCI